MATERGKKDKKPSTPPSTQAERLKVAADHFTEELVDVCKFVINQKAQIGDSVDKKLRLTFSISKDHIREAANGIPRDVLLYGHRSGPWTKRGTLGIKTPFQRAQQILLKEGWYLIEESDPAKSLSIVMALYNFKPGDDHPYFNKEKLWHKNNMLVTDDK